MNNNDAQNTSDKQPQKYSVKADDVLQQGHKRFDRVFENEGGKIISIHCDTLELCILKNEKTSIWEKLCLSCIPVSISLFICVISTKTFNGNSAYWAGFMTALAIIFAIIGAASGYAWYRETKSRMPIYDAIKKSCITIPSPLKDNAAANNLDPVEKTDSNITTHSITQ